MAGRRGMLKRKPNFTLQEIDILMSEVLKYEQLLFGAASTNVNAYEKQKIWWRITSKINAAGRNQRDIGEVKNRWRGLRRRANDKITRHRLQRQAQSPAERPYAAHRKGGGSEPPGQPELGPEWCLHGVCPLDTPPPPGTIEAAALQGVKEEPVKEEPVEVKPVHPLPIDAVQQHVSRGAERRLLRSSGQIPDDPCEDWSRSPPNSSQTELSLSEFGGRQETLGSDYARITFDQESPHGHPNNCNMGDVAHPMTVPIQEGLSESSRFSLAERWIVQANEQLVQEMRAFRQEYAESHRETASILHSIAEALNGVHSSLSEIRDLYLRQQVAPKQ
ncbi:t-SNARE domain-containing protein 1-like [Eublepharis macularius]|uniref:t-SNARE domain-containing protein 1-like n=1 Tax=Eublepharis macularius TaxID=481883 RepID=A0AA97JEB6_EUBMA|nr:t-SNARE domain-containing protein 1-like [Eublepharis macularius]